MTLHPLAATDGTSLPARGQDASPALPGCGADGHSAGGHEAGGHEADGHSADGYGADGEAMLLDSFLIRLGDQIDDRVALSFDEQLAERLADPGPAGRASPRNRRAAFAVVCTSVAAGACITILAPGGAAVSLIAWTAITVINLACLLTRG